MGLEVIQANKTQCNIGIELDTFTIPFFLFEGYHNVINLTFALRIARKYAHSNSETISRMNIVVY